MEEIDRRVVSVWDDRVLWEKVGRLSRLFWSVARCLNLILSLSHLNHPKRDVIALSAVASGENQGGTFW